MQREHAGIPRSRAHQMNLSWPLPSIPCHSRHRNCQPPHDLQGQPPQRLNDSTMMNSHIMLTQIGVRAEMRGCASRVALVPVHEVMVSSTKWAVQG